MGFSNIFMVTTLLIIVYNIDNRKLILNLDK